VEKLGLFVWVCLAEFPLITIFKLFMFIFCVPVCRGSGSWTTWVCVSVWGHGPASSTWHRNLWQQQSRVWLHHRPCVLQLETYWMITVHSVCLNTSKQQREENRTLWRSMWHLWLVLKEILYKVLQTVTPHKGPIFPGAARKMDNILFLFTGTYGFLIDVLFYN